MRAPVLALALLLSGCLGAAAPPAPAPPAPAPEAPLLAVRALVDPAEALWEPSLGVTREGVLFSGSFGRDAQGGGRGAVYRSFDGGATWESLGNPTAPTGNADPHLAVDADGAVWFSTLWVGCVSVAVSRDLGERWQAHPAACAGAVGDRQNLVPTTGGHAVLDWQQFPTKWHVASRTEDHGRTWTPAGLAEPPGLWAAGGVSGWGGSGFWDPVSGAVFVTFSWFEREGAGPGAGYRWSPAFSVSRDGGATWTLHRLPQRDAAHHGVSPVVGAADEAGNLYLAWAETTDEGDTRVMLAASRGDPRAWSEPVRVDAQGGSKVMPALAAGGRGEVALAWYEADQAGHPERVGKDAAWRVHLAWSRDGLAREPAFARALLDEAPVKHGPVCMAGLACEGDRALGDFFSLKRLPDGRVGALWTSAEEAPGHPTLVYAATRDALLAPWR